MFPRRPLSFLAVAILLLSGLALLRPKTPAPLPPAGPAPLAVASLPAVNPHPASTPAAQAPGALPPPAGPAADRAARPETLVAWWADRLQARRVVATHVFPADQDGLVRHLAWFETGLRHPLVRLEHIWAPSDTPGASPLKLVDERAMTASRLLVGIHPDTTPDAAIARLRAEGHAAAAIPLAPALLEVAVPDPVAPEAHDALLGALRASPYHIAFAEPDYLITLDTTPSDPSYPAQWGLRSTGDDASASIDAEAGWSLRHDAAGVIVAITDTGIRPTHQDLAPNLWTNPGEIPGNGLDDDGNGVIDDLHGFNAILGSGLVDDDNGHGTHVAGIVGARGDNGLGIAGVAWNTRLLTAKFLNHLGVGNTTDAVAAIHYARLHGARIINASWSMPSPSLALRDAIRQAGQAGVVLVAAAGNQSTDIDASPRYPAAYDLPNIVAVAATNRQRSLASFSNRGRDRVHLAAPGEAILSTYHLADDHYAQLSGTSMAAPAVAGALALLQAAHPADDAARLIERLLEGVRTAPALDGRVRTGGILHLPAVLRSTRSSPPNDLRASAYAFAAHQGTWTGVTTHAGRSPDDPVTLAGDRTLWFAWTPPGDGASTWRISADHPATHSVAYRVSGGQLHPVAQGAGAEQSLRFFVQAGQSYVLGVGGASPQGHALTVHYAHPPVNDMAADALPLSGETFLASGNNRAATREAGEPRHARVGAGRSVWWRWTAPRSTEQVFTTQGSSFDTVMAAYRVGPSGEWIEVAANDDAYFRTLHSAFTFPAEQGETYLIAVDSWGGGSGHISLGGYGLGKILILDQPRSAAVRLGATASLRVNFLSSGAARVRWFRNGQPIGGGHDGTLVIGNVGPADLGSYRAVISNEQESLDSRTVVLSERISAPVVTWSNPNLNEAVGNPLTLRIDAVGTAPLSYQWFRDEVALPGATASSLYFQSLALSDAGRYHVVITNATGATQSSPFTLRVSDSPFGGWSWVTAPDQGWAIEDIRLFGQTYHAVASAGRSTKILRSTNGETWREQLLPPGFRALQIARGNDTLIVAGVNHTSFDNGTIYRSVDDGATWNTAGLSFRGTVPALHFGNGFFVLLTNHDGTVRRSANGSSWAAPATPPPSGLTRLTFAGGRFFAYRHDFGTALHTSTDGNTWVAATLPATSSVRALMHRDGVFHLWANAYFQSADGLTWTQVGNSSNSLTSLVAHDGTRFFSADSAQLRLHQSADGGAWSAFNIPTTGGSIVQIRSLLHAGGRTLVGCANGLILTAPDSSRLENGSQLFTWTGATSTSRVEFQEDEFILSNRTGTGLVALSGDGATWKTYAVPAQTNLVGNRLWKAGGWYWANSGNASGFWRGRSPLSLAPLPGSPSGALSSIVRHGNRFLAVAGSALYTSLDGDTWTSLSPGVSVSTSTVLRSAGGRVFLVGFDCLASSADGVAWTASPRLNPITHGFVGFAYNQNKFYVVTQSYNQAWESSDGISWVSRTLPFATSGMTEFFAHNGALVFIPSDFATAEQVTTTTNLVDFQTVNTGITARYFAAGKGILVGLGSAGSTVAHLVSNGRAASSAPVCRILSPQADSGVPINSVVEVQVETTLPDGVLDRVELYLDNQLVASSSTAGILSHRFVATEKRAYQLHARAYNTDGLVSGDALGTSAVFATAAPVLNTSPASVNSIASHDGAYYVTTHTGDLYRSRDGLRWDYVDLPRFGSTAATLSVGEGPAPLVINQSGGLMVTRDGIDWTRIASDPFSTFGPLQYRSGVYFRPYTISGVSGLGGTAVSPDGFRWTTSPARNATSFTTVLMGEGPRLVGWSASANPEVRFSRDGLAWSPIPGLPVPRAGIEALDRFFLLGFDNQIRASADGQTWTTHSPGVTTATRLLAAGDRVFAASASHFLATCDESSAWSVLSPAILATRVAHGRGRYLAISSTTAHTSTDGIGWTAIPAPWSGSGGSTFELTHGPSGFVIMNASGKSWVSADGSAWTTGQLFGSEGGSWLDFASVGDTWLALRDVSTSFGPLQRSADRGANWTFSAVPFVHPAYPVSLKSGGAAFFLIDRNISTNAHRLQRSTDGLAWSVINVIANGTAVSPRFILPLTDAWWVLAHDNALYRSADQGATWTRHVIDASGSVQIVDLLWSGQGFLAFAHTQSSLPPLPYFSTDGITWSPATPPPGVLNNATRAAGGGRFLFSRAGQIHVSADGSVWTSATGAPAEQAALLHFGDAFYALGGGTLHRSADALAWTPARGGALANARLTGLGGQLHAYGTSQLIPLHLADAALHTLQVAAPGDYGIGQTLVTTLTVANHGPSALPDLEVELYLSRDGFHGNGDDLRLGRATLGAAELPPPGQTRALPVSLPLPPTLEGGVFHVGAHLDPDRRLGELNKSNNRRFSADTPVNVPEWSLNLLANGDGGVEQSLSAVRYVHGSSVSIAPSTGKDSSFTGWTGSESSERPDLTVTMNGDKTLVANFAPTRQLTVNMRGHGSVQLDRPEGRYPSGATASLVATPAPGWRFAGWEQDLSGASTSTSLAMNANRAVLARFDFPRENWRALHFTPAELADPAVSGDLATPGPLGLPNLLAYLAGRAPRAAAPLGEGPDLHAGTLHYRFTRNTGAVGARLVVESSANLQAWQPVAAERIIDERDGVETIEALVPHDTAQVFIRLRAVIEE